MSKTIMYNSGVKWDEVWDWRGEQYSVILAALLCTKGEKCPLYFLKIIQNAFLSTLQCYVNYTAFPVTFCISECERKICGLWTSWAFALAHLGLQCWFWCLWVYGDSTGSICWGERKRKGRVLWKSFTEIFACKWKVSESWIQNLLMEIYHWMPLLLHGMSY